MKGIDKKEIDGYLAEKKFIGINGSPRSEKVIVSLTSYDKRIHDVKYTIYSLLNQSFPPDKLILWLDEESFPQREKSSLPSDLLELKNFGLTIEWCENLRSYKKLIPALKIYPDDVIVTADDDIFYHYDWLKILYDEHLRTPDSVIAHRAHLLNLDEQGNIAPYKTFQKETKSQMIRGKGSYKNFFTGAGGILYMKKFFHGDIMNRELFMELAPLADDIWFWSMAVLNGTKIKIPSAAQRSLTYVDIKMQQSGETLYSQNITQNDVQLKKVVEHYPALLEKLRAEE